MALCPLDKHLTNIRKVLNLIVHANKSKTPVCLLTLDIEKAFDTLDWQYLFGMLESLEGGPKVINTLKKTSVYKANFPTMIKTLLQNLKKWDKHWISWIGRIHCVKMVLIPKILYLFQTLPIKIPEQPDASSGP